MSAAGQPPAEGIIRCALLGCPSCGFVVRRFSSLGATGECARCGEAMRDVNLEQARTLVMTSQRAERRRAEKDKSYDEQRLLAADTD